MTATKKITAVCTALLFVLFCFHVHQQVGQHEVLYEKQKIDVRLSDSIIQLTKIQASLPEYPDLFISRIKKKIDNGERLTINEINTTHDLCLEGNIDACNVIVSILRQIGFNITNGDDLDEAEIELLHKIVKSDDIQYTIQKSKRLLEEYYKLVIKKVTEKLPYEDVRYILIGGKSDIIYIGDALTPVFTRIKSNGRNLIIQNPSYN